MSSCAQLYKFGPTTRQGKLSPHGAYTPMRVTGSELEDRDKGQPCLSERRQRCRALQGRKGLRQIWRDRWSLLVDLCMKASLRDDFHTGEISALLRDPRKALGTF